MCRGTALHCPVCRGSCHIIARYRVPDESTATASNIPSQPPTQAVTPEQSDRQPDAFILLFTPPHSRGDEAQHRGHQRERHSSHQNNRTTLLGGQLRKIARLGWRTIPYQSRTEQESSLMQVPTPISSASRRRQFAKIAMGQGFRPRQWRMRPMFVQGVSEGQQKCEWTVSIPIACRLSVEGCVCCLNFEAPVVGGSGPRLPALLGLRSLSALSALCMREGQEALFVPVVGNETVDLSQQRRCPLEKAPSGHLITTVDNWEELKQEFVQSPWSCTLILPQHQPRSLAFLQPCRCRPPRNICIERLTA